MGLHSAHGWKAEEAQLASACRLSPSAMLLLPAQTDPSTPPVQATGRYQHGAVGSAQSQHCGLVPAARWGSFTPSFTPRSHRAPDRLTPEGEGPCTGRLGHGWGAAAGEGSGANRKLRKMIWVFPSGRGPRKHSGLCCTWPGRRGLNSSLCAILKAVHSSVD